MINNKLALFTAAAAMAQQVSALSAHRHMHSALEQRAIDAEKRVAELEKRGVVVHTEYVIVTETVKWHAGMAIPAPTDEAEGAAVVEVAAEVPAPAPAAAVPTTMVQVVAPVVEAPPAPEPVIEAPKEEAPKKDTPKKNKPKTKPSGGSPFDGKRGIAYNDANLANTFGSSCESCCWGYNWGSRRDDFSSKYDFVPMLWGDKETFFADWDKNANEMIEQGSKALFSFNEPDIPSQANMSPQLAAQEHKKMMNPFAGKALIGAPSISNSGKANQGRDWLQQWVDACDGQCEFDFCNLHWYSEPEYADTLFEHIEKAHEICGGKPIWLTEFGPVNADSAAIDNFVKTVIPKLDQVEYLDAYSYFMVSEDHLIQGGGLSSAGKLYATVA